MRCLLITLLVSGLIPAVHAGESDAARLLALEQQWLHAIQIRDTAFLNRLLADDFTDISLHGEIRHKHDVMNSPVAPASSTQQLSDMNVRSYGDVAVVTGLNTVTDKHAGWRVQTRFTDVFVERGGHWQAVSAQETLLPQATPVNGN